MNNDISTIVKNPTGYATVNNIAVIGVLPSSTTTTTDYPSNEPFLIKNDSDDSIEVTLYMVGNPTEPIKTYLTPGWNCELVTRVIVPINCTYLKWGR